MSFAEVRIRNRLGLHARAAAKFVQLAHGFEARVTVVRGHARVNGKSILGLLTLAASQGTELRLEAHGPDAGDAVRDLSALVHGRFGEDE